MFYDCLVFLASVAGGVCAAVAGFGIGSILTPVLSVFIGTKTAVALVSIPHFLGTVIRFLLIRRHVDLKLLKVFGFTSLAGGLIGAILNIFFQSRALALILAILLLFIGLAGISGRLEKMRFSKRFANVSGFVSGLLGGLVGNQGGVRSAALLGFDTTKLSFVATATAIALMVDGARVPVYLLSSWRDIREASYFLILSVIGVIAGTLLGFWFFKKIPDKIFKYIVSVIVLALGLFMLVKGS